MKDGYVVKSINSGVPIDGELELINRYTRRKLSADEVYVFSVVLCDNDIDREFDRFTSESLDALAELFVGKTGILDHNTKTDNQTARIFSCSVEEVPGRKNQLNGSYVRLMARAYMPKCEKNNDFILEIDSGIKKEVSVGCAVENVICSVCGTDLKKAKCLHVKGKKYGGKLCHAVLQNPTDAYEWSFVAIPAQREAGVVKALKCMGKEAETEGGGVLNLEDIVKKFELCEEVTITKEQSKQLAEFIFRLQDQASVGKLYLDGLRAEVIKLCALAQPTIGNRVMLSVTEKMSVDELKEFKKAFEIRANEIIPIKPQISFVRNQNHRQQHNEFKI